MESVVEDWKAKRGILRGVEEQIPPLGKGGSPPQLLLLGSHGKHSWDLNLVCHTCMVSMRLVPHVAKTKNNNIALGDMRESKCGGWLMP